MRVCVVAGMPGSGKTTLMRRILEIIDSSRVGVIANNPESEDALKCVCGRTDCFPFRSPCARAKQFSSRVDSMDGVDLLICEPPGSCLETSAPMINPLYVTRKDIRIAPLVTVVDGRGIRDGIPRSTTAGLKTWNMIFESDCVAISFSDELDSEGRTAVAKHVLEVNPDAEVVFASDGIERISAIVSTDGSYRRPLVN